MFGLLKEYILREFATDTENYEGYSDAFILYVGWGVSISVLVIGIIIGLIKWKKNSKEVD